MMPFIVSVNKFKEMIVLNIFDKKLKETANIELPLDPIQLYDTLIHETGYEYLRGIQTEFFIEWNKIRETPDIICKMNTGAGKTLVGLMMLYSKLIEGVGPVVYVCPNKELVLQVKNQAKNYGIPVCIFGGTERIPYDFLNKKSILICTFDKVFNSKSVFGVQNISSDIIEIGAILLDDAHSCVSRASKQSTISISRDEELYNRIFSLFKDSLEKQSLAATKAIDTGDSTYDLIVPYWEWLDKQEKVLDIIYEYIDKNDIVFPLRMIEEDFKSCSCYVSGKKIEIVPLHVPYYKIPSFHKAKHRYCLSATFDDDTDLLKNLGISKESILKPIIPGNRKDIGERLILAPLRFSNRLTDEIMRESISIYKSNYNIVVLVDAGWKAKPWSDLGAEIIDKDNISYAINKLKTSKGNLMVFLNRYDGLDLKEDMCRILVLDGQPLHNDLQEAYMATLLSNSDALKAKTAQTIEQGLGRGVRSGSDYCAVLILGNDLVEFLSIESNLNYFSPVTKMQLKLGLSLLDGEDSKDALETINNTLRYCLEENPSWRTYHKRELLQVGTEELNEYRITKLAMAEIEQNSLNAFNERRYDDALGIIQDYIDKIDKEEIQINQIEKALLFERAAQFIYLRDKVISNDLQIRAKRICKDMLWPPHGFEYSKITKPGVQASIVTKNISEFERPQDISIHVEGILKNLEYNPDIKAKHFEKSLAELGEFLGFSAQTPELDTGNGPDGLWCMPNSKYLILEAKSEKDNNKISRSDIEQLLHSELWFKNNYGDGIDYDLISLQSLTIKEKNTEIKENIRVLSEENLKSLKNNLRSFVSSIQNKNTNTHTEKEIAKLLQINYLTANDIVSHYTEKIR